MREWHEMMANWVHDYLTEVGHHPIIHPDAEERDKLTIAFPHGDKIHQIEIFGPQHTKRIIIRTEKQIHDIFDIDERKNESKQLIFPKTGREALVIVDMRNAVNHALTMARQTFNKD